MDDHALVEAVERALDRALDRRKRVDEETHKMHHEYVARCIERDRGRAQRWEKIRVHVYGWSAVSAIGGLIYAVGEAIRQYLKAKGGP